MGEGELLSAWQSIVKQDFRTEFTEGKKCVLFKHGTLLIIDADKDAEAKAKKQMEDNGHVHAGCAFGDFNVLRPSSGKGWIVTGHDPSMFTYVSEEEAVSTDDFSVGLLGRSKRDMDAEDCQNIHIF